MTESAIVPVTHTIPPGSLQVKLFGNYDSATKFQPFPLDLV